MYYIVSLTNQAQGGKEGMKWTARHETIEMRRIGLSFSWAQGDATTGVDSPGGSDHKVPFKRELRLSASQESSTMMYGASCLGSR